MKRFESFLGSELEDYVRYRLSLGYHAKNLRSILLPFDQYAKENAVDWYSLQPSFFVGLRKGLKGEASTINGILSGVRAFFEFLVRQGYYSHNLVQDVPSYQVKPYIPFVFSEKETEQLLRAIQERFHETKENNLGNASVCLAILMLARCGLRISEPVRILMTHYRDKEGTIYIEKTKFRNSRLLPIPHSVLDEIQKYLAMRNSLVCDDENPYLLVGQRQQPLSTHQIYTAFRQGVKDIGLDQPRQSIANTIFGAPTPHSLRHSFAVNTLKRMRTRREYTRYALEVLAVYMGHRRVSYTGQYLAMPNAEHRQKLLNFAISHQEEI